MKISVIGLGKLGSPLAAVLASKGHTVIGVDTNPAFVAAINVGRAPVQETGLQELIGANAARLSATTDCGKAVGDSEVTFIIVPTPSEENGFFSLQYAIAAVEEIGRALKSKSSYHVVALTSTVMPGSTGGPIQAALEKASGKRCGVDFGLCYNPEFIALGSVIRDMLYPDMILIGESDDRAGKVLQGIYDGVCQSKPRMCRMNFVNAELTKLSVNTFVTTKISYANMLAELCENLPTADVDIVTDAVGSDARIGRKYLKGALGFGGPCFPRDNHAWSALARSKGIEPSIPEATDQINKRQAKRLAARVFAALPDGATVAILGTSYKPCSEVVEQSPAIALARTLIERGARLIVHDPAAMRGTRQALGEKVAYADTMEQAVARADLVVLMTPWEEYKKLTPAMLAGRPRKVIVLDCWRFLDTNLFADVAEILLLGKGEKAGQQSPAKPVATVHVDVHTAKKFTGKSRNSAHASA